eukprot:SM000053S17423  [mRNA]  locus=s53:260207:260832:- [translate_table: standard]
MWRTGRLLLRWQALLYALVDTPLMDGVLWTSTGFAAIKKKDTGGQTNGKEGCVGLQDTRRIRHLAEMNKEQQALSVFAQRAYALEPSNPPHWYSLPYVTYSYWSISDFFFDCRLTATISKFCSTPEKEQPTMLPSKSLLNMLARM